MKNLTLTFILLTLLSGCDKKIEITGRVFNEHDGNPLYQAFITDSRTGTTILSDKDGSFSIYVEEGDSLNISFAGFCIGVKNKESQKSLIFKTLPRIAL